jgi:hypothetical protein
MSIITSSGLRASVSAVAAVALTSLLAWGFASSTADIQWLGSDAVAPEQVASTASSDRDSRNG